MRRVFRGMAGVMFGVALIVPSLLMEETVGGAGGSMAAVLTVSKLAGTVILVGVPLVYWAVLPYIDRKKRESEQDNTV